MRTALRVSAVAVALWATGCSSPSLFQSHRAPSQRDAGSFHFAVVAVAPWESAVQQLEPRFHLSEEQALDAVLAVTRTVEESVRHLAKSTLAVGAERAQHDATTGADGTTTDPATDTTARDPAVNPGNGTSTTTGTTYGESTGYGSGTGTGNASNPYGVATGTNSAPPVATGATQAPPRTPGVDAVDLASLLNLDAHPLDHLNRDKQDTDPLTRYWAATSLFQEVQLIGQSLRHALVRHGYRAYIVRLKLTLLPNARDEPYDAFCSLSFFTRDRDGGDDRVARLPQIVPILVTDDLERSKHSRIVDDSRELAAALRYLTPLASAGASVSDVLDRVQSVGGADVNSLFTVTRITDNTLGVRLGAVQQAESDFAMIPQNHTVTALLLVPDGDGAHVDVLADARFVDAESGIELPAPTPTELDAALERQLLAFGLDRSTRAHRAAMMRATRWNDWAGFRAALQAAEPESAGDRRVALELWQNLSMTTSRFGTSVTGFDLPPSLALDSADPGLGAQTALCQDDGGSTLVVVKAGELPFDTRIAASLNVRGADGSARSLLARELHFDPITRQLELRFDSLEAWQLRPATEADLSLALTVNGLRDDLRCRYRTATGEVAAAAATPEHAGIAAPAATPPAAPPAAVPPAAPPAAAPAPPASAPGK